MTIKTGQKYYHVGSCVGVECIKHVEIIQAMLDDQWLVKYWDGDESTLQMFSGSDIQSMFEHDDYGKAKADLDQWLAESA